MKTNIKSRITVLFICKTTMMVNKREKIYFIVSISDKRLSLFFLLCCPFVLLFSSFFPYLFCFNFVISERNVNSFLPTYLGGTFFPLLDVSEQCTPPPPCVRAWSNCFLSLCTIARFLKRSKFII